ncbi:hypothetical protein F9L67_10355 [Brucella melitensis]|nr:hypothetical protein F9L67_10355 [Brucella melitensis]
MEPLYFCAFYALSDASKRDRKSVQWTDSPHRRFVIHALKNQASFGLRPRPIFLARRERAAA